MKRSTFYLLAGAIPALAALASFCGVLPPIWAYAGLAMANFNWGRYAEMTTK